VAVTCISRSSREDCASARLGTSGAREVFFEASHQLGKGPCRTCIGSHARPTFTVKVARHQALCLEVRGELTDAPYRSEARFERPSFGAVSFVQSARERAAGSRPLTVDGANAMFIGRRAWRERAAWLGEALAVAEDAQSVPPRGCHFIGSEVDAPKERAIAAERARLAKRRKVGIHVARSLRR
jgi:hypothetical protein